MLKIIGMKIKKNNRTHKKFQKKSLQEKSLRVRKEVKRSRVTQKPASRAKD